MKSLTTTVAVIGFALLVAAAPQSASDTIHGNCGKCDVLADGRLGSSAQIPLRTSADKATGNAYKCTSFGKDVQLLSCTNQFCGLCMIFE
jgi:aerobic-type carbon monoxide dehydrogenase small subunit (CoxS/CutS family)